MPKWKLLASLVVVAVLALGPVATWVPWCEGPATPAADGPSPTELAPRNERASFSTVVPAEPSLLASYSGLFYTGSAMETASGGNGQLVSQPIPLSVGKRWDHARTLISLMLGTASIEVWDATSGTYPSTAMLARDAVWGPVSFVSVDLLEEDHLNVTQVQVVVKLDHSGQTGTPPSVSAFAVAQCDLDYWHDPFWDLGRESDRGDLHIGMGNAVPNRTHIPGGLVGSYFNSRDFTNFAFDRLDPRIDFDWGNGPPGGGMGANTFSIRWQGKLMVPTSGTYTFYLRIDDGGRLWVDGQQIINEWRDQSPTEFSGQALLTEGLHDIRIDYYENQGGASCEFRWAGPGISKRLVPPTALWGRNATNVLVSEDIVLPEGQVWDLLLIDLVPGAVPLVLDLIDSGTGQPVYGYTDLSPVDRDISSLSPGTYPALRLRARWAEGAPAEAPRLIDWGLKWMPELTWRCEFLTSLKVVGTVGLEQGDGKVTLAGSSEQTSMFAFAEAFDGTSRDIESTVYKGDYWSTDIPTQNASDVAIGDLDGDGFDDIVFASGDPGVNVTAFRGGAGGFPNAPSWTFGHGPGAGRGAYFKEVVLGDLDHDGRVDVVLVEADPTRPRDDRLLIYLNNATGWNGTPDDVLDDLGGAVSGVGLGDINGRNSTDMVIGFSDGEYGLRLVYDYRAGQTLVDWYAGWNITAVHVADVDGDGYADACVGGTYTQGYNLLHIGMSLGLYPPSTSLGGEPARAITFADWNGDGRRDVVLVEGDGVTIRLQDALGDFPDSRSFTVRNAVDVATIRASGDDDEDLAVACDSLSPEDGGRYMEAIGSVGLFQRIFMTDTAVAVAAGSPEAEFSGSLRTTVIDVGDPDRAGNFTTLTFRPPESDGWFGSGQSIRFVMRDAADDELLWERGWSHGQGAGQNKGPGVTADIDPPVNARMHPRVYLEVLMVNEGDAPMDLGHVEVRWERRVPQRPTVLSLSADEGTIYRTNSTTLRVTADDDLDPPEDLDLTVQMRPPTGGGYITDRLDDPVWDGAGWTVRFFTTRDDPAGAYSFRVSVLDSDMLESDWYETQDLVTVLNNPPGAPVIGIDPQAPLTTDDLECRLLRQAPDIDTVSLDYEYWWYIEPSDEPSGTAPRVPSNLTVRGQTWRVRVRAFDGDDHGPWVEARVSIGNTPPRLIAPLDRLDTVEDHDPLVIRLGDHFVDPDGDDLTFSVEGDGNIRIELDPLSQRLTLALPQDWHGVSNVTINASDGEAWTSTTLRVFVASVNDEPRVVSVDGRGPMEGDVFYVEAWEDIEAVFAVVVEDVDSSTFRFRTDAEFSKFSVGARNGTMTVTTTNAEVGARTFNLSVEDLDGAVTVVNINITVHNTNDPPGIITIIQPKNGRTFEEGTVILLQGSCKDPDEIHGQRLTFTWLSNATGELGQGPSVSVSDLPVGKHRITLRVSDGEVQVTESVRIEVLAKEPGPDGNGGGGDGSPLVPSVSGGGLLALVLLLILALAIALVYLNRGRIGMRRRREDTSEAMPMAPREVDITMVHGIPMPVDHKEAVTREEPGMAGTDIRSVMMGRSKERQPYEEAIPVSPWSEETLRSRPPSSPPPGQVPPSPPSAPEPSPSRQRPPQKLEESDWEEM